MLIAARNGFMVGKRLPYDAEVEYVTIPQDSYIETDIIYGETYDSIELSGKFYGRTATLGYIICDLCPYYTVIRFIENGDNSLSLKTDVSTVSLSLSSTTFGQDTTLTIASLGTWQGIPADGSRLIIGKLRNWDYSTKTITSISGTHSPKSQYKRIVVRQNGNIVQNYMPVRKGIEGFLYDSVRGKLFGTNDGVAMGYGPDAQPPAA